MLGDSQGLRVGSKSECCGFFWKFFEVLAFYFQIFAESCYNHRVKDVEWRHRASGKSENFDKKVSINFWSKILFESSFTYSLLIFFETNFMKKFCNLVNSKLLDIATVILRIHYSHSTEHKNTNTIAFMINYVKYDVPLLLLCSWYNTGK